MDAAAEATWSCDWVRRRDYPLLGLCKRNPDSCILPQKERGRVFSFVLFILFFFLHYDGTCVFLLIAVAVTHAGPASRTGMVRDT